MGKQGTVWALGVCVLAMGSASALGAPISFSNTIYDVYVEDGSGGSTSRGSWTAETGSSHPVGPGRNILFSPTTTGTNYSSLRVYGPTAIRDYTPTGHGSSIDLDPLVTLEAASPYGSSGRRTVWTLTSEGLIITQDVFLVGATLATSAIYHTVEIFNSGTQHPNGVSVGWRNLYDWNLDDPGFDDGPNNSIETTGGVVVGPSTTEFTHTPGAGEFVRVSVDPGVPTYEPLQTLGFDPLLGPFSITTPDAYAYVHWPSAFGTPFDYTPTGTNSTFDSAGLSWFGRTAGSSYFITPGGSVRFTQALFGVPARAPPPTIPEPATVALFGLGLGFLGIGVARRRRKKKALVTE